jgi:protein involved in polysaccharide export with SLBB domain
MRRIVLLGLLSAGIGFSQNYSVDGEVLRPGSYSLQPTTSLLSALAASGGSRPTADLSHVMIQRGGKEILIDVRAIMVGKKPDVPLEDGDRIILGTKKNPSTPRFVQIAGVQAP